MSIRFTVFAALLVASSSASASYQSSVDNDGCWDAKTSDRTKCLQLGTHFWRENTIYVTYQNKCGERIFVKACHDRKSGDTTCRVFGIFANSDFIYRTTNASGNVHYNAVGSTNSARDRTCEGRWNMKVK